MEAERNMLIEIIGTDLPGRNCCGYANVHVGVQRVYLTWGDVASDGTFEMFRRLKLMWDGVDGALLRMLDAGSRIRATLAPTDERGGPRCAAVRPPQVRWSVEN